MARTNLTFSEVSFQYETSVTPLFDALSFSLGPGWTAVCGANGSGKTTLLKLAAGILTPQLGSIISPDNAAYCEQRTDEPDEAVFDFHNTYDADCCRLRGMLGLEEDWIDRWETLSHGERKRMQLASLLHQEPDLLLVDEPTNHLDVDAKEYVINALRRYDGIGLLVSHDRALMDTLCSRCLYIEPPAVDLRSGSYTDTVAAKQREYEHEKREYLQTRDKLEKLKKEAHRREQKAAVNAKKHSKKKLRWKDSDGRSTIDAARVSGKDAAASQLASSMKKRVVRTQSRLESIVPKKEYDMGIWVEGSRSHHDFIFETGERTIPLGDEKVLRLPSLRVGAAERVGISGANGSGKSTLIKYLTAHLSIADEKLLYIPQEIEAEQSAALLKRITELPQKELGRLMSIISRLGSKPDRLLESELPSPGETRKLLLAKGVMGDPHCIVMDEPTNHMDLPSIECLESALAEAPCALVLVSHDLRFLDAIANTRWRTVQETAGYRLEVDI